MVALTIEQVENRIKAQQAETERAIAEAMKQVPIAIQDAIARKQAVEGAPKRLPTTSTAAPEIEAGWSDEDTRLQQRLRKGAAPTLTEMASIAEYQTQSRKKSALMRYIGRYSPAAKAYAENPEDQQYRSLSEFLEDVYKAKPGSRWAGISPRLKASLAEGSGDTGGFLVPEEFRSEIYALEIEGAQFEPLATTLPMTSMTLKVPTIRDTTHVGSVFGGITGFWEPEAGSLQESEPTFGTVQLEAHKLTLYTVASNEVLNDAAIGLEALIRQRFPEAHTWYKETGFWNGDGGGMPEGVLNSAAVYAQAKESGQASSTVLYENIVNMYAHMLPTSHRRAVWFCHPAVLPQLATMALSVGTGGGPIFIQFGGAQNDFPMTLFGRPLYVSEHMAGLGTQGDIAYVDLSYYVIGTRQDLSFEASQHVKFINDQTVWRMISRLDGKPWIDSSLTLEHGSFSVSPFVVLAAR